MACKEHLRKIPWLILGITAVGGFLRAIALGRNGLWYDEVVTVLGSRESLSSMVQHMGQPPLYSLILHFWILAFGQSDVAVQSLSVLIGIACIPLMYLIGAELFDKKIGLAAAFIMAISGFAIYYSVEVRMYSLLLLLTLLSFLCFVRLLMANRPSKMQVLCYSISNILMCFTQLYGFFTIGVQILYFVLFRHRYAKAKVPFWSAQAITLIAFGAAIVPIIGLFRVVAVGSIAGDVPPFSSLAVLQQLTAFCGWGAAAPILTLVFGSLCIMAFLHFPTARSEDGSRESGRRVEKAKVTLPLLRPKRALLLLWLLVPLLASLAISIVWEPIFRAKYLIDVTPALYLLTAQGVVSTGSYFRRFVKPFDVTHVALAIISLCSVLSLADLYLLPQHEQWREAARFVQTASQPDDVVVVSPSGYLGCFDYYYKGTLQEFGTSANLADNQTLTDFVTTTTAGRKLLWLVLLTYENTINAPIKPFLELRFGGPVQEKELYAIHVYLFDVQAMSP